MLLISLAYSYESIGYFSEGKPGSVVACEETSETGESSEKTEKEILSDDDYFSNKHLHNRLILHAAERGSIHASQDSNFASSDYSFEVYSPPENA
jgi:hypothetical protein